MNTPRTVLLLTLFCGLACAKPPETVHHLNGAWTMQIRPSKGTERLGIANINQLEGAAAFSIEGNLQHHDSTKLTMAFSSLAGSITKSRAVFVYMNAEEEMGVAEATIAGTSPNRLEFNYFDCYTRDKNDDPLGTIILLR